MSAPKQGFKHKISPYWTSVLAVLALKKQIGFHFHLKYCFFIPKSKSQHSEAYHLITRIQLNILLLQFHIASHFLFLPTQLPSYTLHILFLNPPINLQLIYLSSIVLYMSAGLKSI